MDLEQPEEELLVYMYTGDQEQDKGDQDQGLVESMEKAKLDSRM